MFPVQRKSKTYPRQYCYGEKEDKNPVIIINDREEEEEEEDGVDQSVHLNNDECIEFMMMLLLYDVELFVILAEAEEEEKEAEE
ncbi:hypothetical protein G5I_01872 [Acromyrmex echinatior]|uniref:Uncharacterized protein n=1 Tax=Acromyrmex echinatior TaxID=103372 RepID=F4W8T5_ACREC|nr:hypothetical protein G5I_01872 [Acromyrmex echinatior]